MADDDFVKLSRENYASMVRDSAILYEMVSSLSTVVLHALSEKFDIHDLVGVEVVERYKELAAARAEELQAHIDEVEAR